MSIAELPLLHQNLSRIRGRFRLTPEDFRVDEVPVFNAEGHGEHLFVHFEKTNLNTPEAVKRIAQALDVLPYDCGWAGLKDRRAITTQWASFFGAERRRAEGLDIPGIRILDAKPHPRKLRTGQLRANRFSLVIRDTKEEEWPSLQSVAQAITQRGVPNYFGEQRFGREGDNVPKALAWLRDGARTPRGRFERKMLVSALQSHWFNLYLAERVREQRLDKVEVGELVHEEPAGRLYVAEDLEREQTRVDQWQTSPTGPIYGSRMRWPKALAEARERHHLLNMEADDALLLKFERIGAGSRRPVRMRPDDLQVSRENQGVLLQFTLPAGAYATVVLREILSGDAQVGD